MYFFITEGELKDLLQIENEDYVFGISEGFKTFQRILDFCLLDNFFPPFYDHAIVASLPRCKPCMTEHRTNCFHRINIVAHRRPIAVCNIEVSDRNILVQNVLHEFVNFWAQFHQCSTYSFYTCRSQKRKKTLTTQLYSLRFWDL